MLQKRKSLVSVAGQKKNLGNIQSFSDLALIPGAQAWMEEVESDNRVQLQPCVCVHTLYLSSLWVRVARV